MGSPRKEGPCLWQTILIHHPDYTPNSSNDRGQINSSKAVRVDLGGLCHQKAKEKIARRAWKSQCIYRPVSHARYPCQDILENAISGSTGGRKPAAGPKRSFMKGEKMMRENYILTSVSEDALGAVFVSREQVIAYNRCLGLSLSVGPCALSLCHRLLWSFLRCVLFSLLSFPGKAHRDSHSWKL